MLKFAQKNIIWIGIFLIIPLYFHHVFFDNEQSRCLSQTDTAAIAKIISFENGNYEHKSEHENELFNYRVTYEFADKNNMQHSGSHFTYLGGGRGGVNQEALDGYQPGKLINIKYKAADPRLNCQYTNRWLQVFGLSVAIYFFIVLGFVGLTFSRKL